MLAASAGGVEALRTVIGHFPAKLPAAVLVVLHIPAGGRSVLPDILARAGRLPARHPRDGEPLADGVVLVAPPGRHLVVEGRSARILVEAREHGHRPSADVLLRSAATNFGPRCAGVVLSGTMDDGAAGLSAVRADGGFTVVQDPATAAFPGMPQAALADGPPDYVGDLSGISGRLVDWLAQLPAAPAPVPALAPATVPATALHADLVREDDDRFPDEPGDPGRELTALTCPECGGTLWRVDAQGSEQFRCRIGHAYSAHGVLDGKKVALEAALWAAIVALDERAEVAGRIARRLRSTGRPSQHARYVGEVAASHTQAAVLRKVVRDLIEDAAGLNDSSNDGVSDADSAS